MAKRKAGFYWLDGGTSVWMGLWFQENWYLINEEGDLNEDVAITETELDLRGWKAGNYVGCIDPAVRDFS
jgi:hypothetical protein